MCIASATNQLPNSSESYKKYARNPQPWTFHGCHMHYNDNFSRSFFCPSLKLILMQKGRHGEFLASQGQFFTTKKVMHTIGKLVKSRFHIDKLENVHSDVLPGKIHIYFSFKWKFWFLGKMQHSKIIKWGTIGILVTSRFQNCP